MIQRIQSVWLLLVAVFAFLTFKFPFYVGTNAKAIPSYELLARESFLIAALTIMIGGLALFTIFLFKNRPLQLTFCFLGIILELVLLFLYYREVKVFIGGSPTLWSVFHIGIIAFFAFAAQGINKDKKLIEDSDRLR